MERMWKTQIVWKKIGITAGVYLGMKYLVPLLVPFFLAALLVCWCWPALKWLQRRFHIKPAFSMGLLLLAMSALLAAGGVWLGKGLGGLFRWAAERLSSPGEAKRLLDECCESIGGLMQHVEAAGVHSGDSACSLPPYSLRKDILDEVRRETTLMAKALGVVGLMNVQFAIKGAVTENPLVYVLEVNPRASRTVPFVSKATGEPLAKIAARCMVGKTFAEQGAKVEVTPSRICVKEAVFPFAKFLGVDPVLGPEMRSTGEVMGVGKTFGEALFKSQLGSGSILPPAGTVFISVRDEDKPRAIVVASELLDKGYSLVATRGTPAALAHARNTSKVVTNGSEGPPSVIDKIKNHEIQLVITTSNESRGEISDARDIRMAALANRVTYYTTIAGGRAAVEGIKHLTDAQVCSLQEMYAEAAKA